MDAATPAEDRPKILTARELRQENEIVIELAPGRNVVARKLDIVSLVFEGLIPLPMLAAVQKMTKTRGLSAIDRLEGMDDEDKASILQLIRKNATVALIEPVCTPMEDGNPDHVPVTMFTVKELMEIWNQTAMVPMMEPADAARFRPRVSADASAPGSTVEAVRPAAEPVDSRQEVEVRSA